MGRKWENIKRGKARLDQARGATISRLTKDLMKAAKEGGADPEANLRLKAAIKAAREANVPGDNIQRAILRGSGQWGDARYEEIVYEGYGPGGVAVMMHISTDNRNRTAADVRHIFTKHGGSLGETGCVGWMFTKKGIITVDHAASRISEDDLMSVVLDAGAEDIQTGEDAFEVITAPEDLDHTLRALEKAGIPVERGETAMIPTTTVAVSGENAERLMRMLELLEDHDDVQNVYSNADIADEE